MVQNKALIFKKVPSGLPVPGVDLVVEATDFDLNQAPPFGGVTTKNFYASLDPYQRGKLRPADIKSYSPPYTLNKPINNLVVAQILKSDHDAFQTGDLVTGMITFEEYSATSKGMVDATFKKIVNPYKLDLKEFTGALGMPGMTAYSSFYEIGKPKKGETMFVSAASGAVGQLVGQLGKHAGLKVIGSVGSDDKLDFITKELGFDGGFNYKKEKPLDALKRLAPEGLDIYYENVGGEQLQAAIECMKDFGRIIACGMVSEYNKGPNERFGVTNLMLVVGRRLTIRGFIQGDEDMGPKYREERDKNVAKWLHEGTFKSKLSVTDGLDNGAEGFIGMLQGKNFGKAVLKIADPEVSFEGPRL